MTSNKCGDLFGPMHSGSEKEKVERKGGCEYWEELALCIIEGWNPAGLGMVGQVLSRPVWLDPSRRLDPHLGHPDR